VGVPEAVSDRIWIVVGILVAVMSAVIGDPLDDAVLPCCST
jgi:hypothetical protein